MPAFLRPGNFIVLLSRSNADCQFLSGILIIADRLTTASSSVGPPPLGIPRPMLYICFSVSVFCFGEHLERQSIDTKSSLQHSILGLESQLLKSAKKHGLENKLCYIEFEHAHENKI